MEPDGAVMGAWWNLSGSLDRRLSGALMDPLWQPQWAPWWSFDRVFIGALVEPWLETWWDPSWIIGILIGTLLFWWPFKQFCGPQASCALFTHLRNDDWIAESPQIHRAVVLRLPFAHQAFRSLSGLAKYVLHIQWGESQQSRAWSPGGPRSVF